MWVKVVIVLVFIGIIASLGSAMYAMVTDKGNDSTRTVKALSWRIGLSAGLFAFLMLLAALGVIQPHGVVPVQSEAPLSESSR